MYSWSSEIRMVLYKYMQVTQQHGSISIALTEGRKGTSRENVEFSCTKVGEIVNGEYRLKEEFLSLSVNFNKIESANDMEDIAEEVGNYGY